MAAPASISRVRSGGSVGGASGPRSVSWGAKFFTGGVSSLRSSRTATGAASRGAAVQRSSTPSRRIFARRPVTAAGASPARICAPFDSPADRPLRLSSSTKYVSTRGEPAASAAESVSVNAPLDSRRKLQSCGSGTARCALLRAAHAHGDVAFQQHLVGVLRGHRPGERHLAAGAHGREIAHAIGKVKRRRQRRARHSAPGQNQHCHERRSHRRRPGRKPQVFFRLHRAFSLTESRRSPLREIQFQAP